MNIPSLVLYFLSLVVLIARGKKNRDGDNDSDDNDGDLESTSNYSNLESRSQDENSTEGTNEGTILRIERPEILDEEGEAFLEGLLRVVERSNQWRQRERERKSQERIFGDLCIIL